MPVDSRLLCMTHVSVLDEKARSQGTEAYTGKVSNAILKVRKLCILWGSARPCGSEQV